MKVVTSEQMRAIEVAADGEGLTFAEMMRRAGAGTAREANAIVPPGTAVLVICGPGNNGGDGLVAATLVQESGTQVRAITWRRPTDDLLHAAKAAGVEILALPDDGPISRRLARTAAEWVDGSGLVIDALFGTGLSRPIEGVPAEILRLVGAGPGRRRVVAVDVPSGLDADTGAVDPLTLHTDVTIAFGFPKVGHFFMPGAERVGRLVVDPIGIDRRYAASSESEIEMITGDRVRDAIPPRPIDGHKGTFGHAMIVAGSIRYTGAAVLAAEAAYRAGAGLVTLAIPRAIHTAVAARLREAIFLPLPDDGDAVAPEAAALVREALAGADACLIGPGLTTGDGAARVLDAAIDTLADRRRAGERGDRPAPIVVDADALSALAADPSRLSRLPAGTVLTPHPGEMARLITAAPAPGWSPGVTPEGIDRLKAARDHARAWGAVIVMKGANTVVANPDGRAAIIPFATSALATAGTGDVLAGIITGILAGGAEPFEAAWCGAWIHGLCGILVRDGVGARATMAGDVLAYVPEAFAAVEGQVGAEG